MSSVWEKVMIRESRVRVVKLGKSMGSVAVLPPGEVLIPMFELVSNPTIDLREMAAYRAKRQGYLVPKDERPE